VVALVSNERITIFFGVPAMYHILLQNPKFSAEYFPHIRLLTYGASIMPKETILTLRQRFPQAEIRNLYGQTENSPAVTGLDDRYALSKPGSVGRPLPGMTVSIFDDNNREVAAGVVGEIVTQGINLMKGYFKNEDALKEVVQEGWYHTGDLGYLDEEGFLYVVDRKKDMIIRGGQNIYPAEIENVLYTHTDILECAVIGIAHPILGEEVAAIVVRRQGSTITEEMIIQFTRERIAAYKVPVRVRFVDELPHNASGKILKRELRELAQQGAL
jgi:long-chain acyl-CoA synthetase